MIRNRKTVKGKLGKTRPKDTDFAGIARKQSRTKKTTTTSNRPTDARTKSLRAALKGKQKVAGKVGKGSRVNQAFLGGSARQTVKPKPKKSKRVLDRAVKRAEPTKKANVRKAMDKIAIGDQYGRPFGMKAGGKTSKYRMAGGGKTSKYRMAGGGKTSKYRAAAGGKMPMVMKDGKKIPAFAADGKGKMKKGGKAKLMGGGKASKYRMKGGGKTSKYMAKGGKTSKYMARGGRAK